MDTPLRERNPDRGCKMEGCERSFYANGFCYLHWERDRDGTDMDLPIRKPVPGTVSFKVYRLFFTGGRVYVGMTGQRCLSARLQTHKHLQGWRLQPLFASGEFKKAEIIKEYPKTQEGRELALLHEEGLIQATADKLGHKCLNLTIA